MTSKLTRERLQEIAEDGFLKHGESKELARMALAAMDSEPVEMPLDYLQGHKDGLEWASQLAEANHPETGDWLYDDPIELAKAIRKGPDMPPAQPVAGSEPDRNPVLAYADSYRDMAKQGIESVPIWSVITDLERNIAPLYRHAQQSVVPDAIPVSRDIDAGYLSGWNDCRAAMLQAVPLTNEGDIQAGNSPVILDGSASMLRRWLAFGRGMQNAGSQLPHNLIAETESMLAAAPQSPSSEPATVPGKWIPVSEQMPEDRTQVILWDAEIGEVTSGHYSHKTQTFYHCGDAIENEITHWMPPPCAPQEVNRE